MSNFRDANGAIRDILPVGKLGSMGNAVVEPFTLTPNETKTLSSSIQSMEVLR
jgi:hypothetical protein